MKTKHQIGQSALSTNAWARVSHEFGLTERETAIVRLVFNDMHDSEIAAELAISAHTVNTHLTNIFMKAGVHSRIQLVILVLVENRNDGVA